MFWIWDSVAGTTSILHFTQHTSETLGSKDVAWKDLIDRSTFRVRHCDFGLFQQPLDCQLV